MHGSWLADRQLGQRIREAEALGRLRRAARKVRRRRFLKEVFWPTWAFIAVFAFTIGALWSLK